MNAVIQKIGTVFAALIVASLSVTAAVGPAVHSAPFIA